MYLQFSKKYKKEKLCYKQLKPTVIMHLPLPKAAKC